MCYNVTQELLYMCCFVNCLKCNMLNHVLTWSQFKQCDRAAVTRELAKVIAELQFDVEVTIRIHLCKLSGCLISKVEIRPISLLTLWISEGLTRAQS